MQLPSGPALSVEGPLVRTHAILADSTLQDLLRNGFPARLRFHVELWTVGGWFNDIKDATDWEVIVRYDPLAQTYQVARLVGDLVTPLGQFAQFPAAAAAAERSFRAPIAAPKRRGRYYYDVTLDVETLSLSDLDEVEQWLRGELKPAVRGQRNPGTAVTRGVRKLVVKLLGSDRRTYVGRSATFRI